MAAFLKFVQTNGQPVIINPDHVIYCVPDPDDEEHTRIICTDNETVFIVQTSFKKIANDPSLLDKPLTEAMRRMALELQRRGDADDTSV